MRHKIKFSIDISNEYGHDLANGVVVASTQLVRISNGDIRGLFTLDEIRVSWDDKKDFPLLRAENEAVETAETRLVSALTKLIAAEK